MGISANQVRLMTLTARQSDLEYKAQQISAIKMRISQQTSDLALEYSNALSTYSKLNSAFQYIDQFPSAQFKVAKDGTVTCTELTTDNDGNLVYTTGLSADSAKAQVRSMLGVKAGLVANEYLTLEKDKYTVQTDQLSAQEKLYDMDLTQVNTEHEAIKTEYDAIKSLVKDNTEKSFNVFG